MARPSTPIANWASNANYASGLSTGSPTKAAPSAGQIADGWHPNQKPPPNWENWWHNLADAWALYFDEPRSDAAKDYPLAARGLFKRLGALVGNANFDTNLATAGLFAQRNVLATDFIAWEITPPAGSVLDVVIVGLQGQAGHGGVPGAKPVVQVISTDVFSGAPVVTVLGTANDISVGVGGYEAFHLIQVGPLAHTVTATEHLTVYLTGESGANAIVGLKSWGGYFDISVTSVDPR